MTTYRTGNHWGVTIVRQGDMASDFSDGRHPDDQLVAVVVNGDQALAERICALLNTDERAAAHADDCNCGDTYTDPWCAPRKQYPDSCICTIVGPHPGCPVHHGRRARGPKPPPVGPGCICDGSGRACPRHGEVI